MYFVYLCITFLLDFLTKTSAACLICDSQIEGHGQVEVGLEANGRCV